MRSFNGQKTVTGSWQEDLDSIIYVYEILEAICQTNEDENLKEIPIMLSTDTFLYYSSHAKPFQTYGDASNARRL